jgi:hypothetical protein
MLGLNAPRAGLMIAGLSMPVWHFADGRALIDLWKGCLWVICATFGSGGEYDAPTQRRNAQA